MKKNRIRLNESQLHRVIKESVKRVVREGKVGGSDYFPEGTNPNTKDGYLRLLVGKFVIEDGMDSMQALKKANEIINQKFGK